RLLAVCHWMATPGARRGARGWPLGALVERSRSPLSGGVGADSHAANVPHGCHVGSDHPIVLANGSFSPVATCTKASRSGAWYTSPWPSGDQLTRFERDSSAPRLISDCGLVLVGVISMSVSVPSQTTQSPVGDE